MSFPKFNLNRNSYGGGAMAGKPANVFSTNSIRPGTSTSKSLRSAESPLSPLFETIMKNFHTFELTPPRETAQALAQAYQGDSDRVPGKKLRRTVFPVKGKYGRVFAEITVIESGEASDFQGITLECKIDFAAWLVGPGAFADNVFSRPAGMLLPWLKSWLQGVIPLISTETLEQITDDHISLTYFTALYLFDAGSPTEAFTWYISLLHHCKVLLDSGAPYPGSKKRSLPWTSRMRFPSTGRQAFEVDLEHLPSNEVFGQARVSLLLDEQDQPIGFAHSEFQAPEVLRQKSRNLLCIAVTVDSSKNLHFGEEHDHKLASDFRRWTKVGLSDDPARLIFEAMRYALWLNLRMATDATQVNVEGWSTAMKEVLAMYFAGSNMQQSVWIAGDDDLLKYRRQLINKAGVDILVPWAIARLNMSKFLETRLIYDNRFLPGEDMDLAAYTLSVHNIDAQITALQEQLDTVATKRDEEPWPLPKNPEKEEARD